MDPTQQTLRSAVCLFDELFETHLWHIFEGSCLKYKHFGTLPDVLHGVSIEEQEAQVVWSRLQDACNSATEHM